jgi:hypothetical protein
VWNLQFFLHELVPWPAPLPVLHSPSSILGPIPPAGQLQSCWERRPTLIQGWGQNLPLSLCQDVYESFVPELGGGEG